MIDLLIRGGTLVLPNRCVLKDLAIDQGRILEVAQPGEFKSARRVIEAEACYVIPGGVDPHVHVQWPFLESTTPEDYASASIAAALGGTTTIIDFAHPKMGSTPADRIAARRSQADGRIMIDYGLHCVLTDSDPNAWEDLVSAVEAGVPSFKLYMTYRRRGIMVSEATLSAVLQQSVRLKAVVCVHAESGTMAEANEARFVAEGRTRAVDFPEHKPNEVEAEAVSRAIYWARQAGARLYVLHLSTKEGLALVRAARQDGVRVAAETCPQYLLLDERVYARPADGHRFICSPPLRSRADVDALWEGIAEGSIEVVGTDHCPFTKAQKDKYPEDFREVPNGLPGVETRLPLLYSEGVAKGRISMTDLVRVTSTNPARVFGLVSQKGTLEPGSDADVVLLDPEVRWTLSADRLHMGADWSPYEGRELQGAPVMTILRGEVIAERGEFLGRVGQGRFVHRALIG